MADPIRKLTDPQRNVLRLLGQGHDAKSISSELGISVNAVSERLRDVRRKMGVSSSREAARIFLASEDAHKRDRNFGDKKIEVEFESVPPPNPPLTGDCSRKHSRRYMMVGGLMFGTIAIAALAFTADDQIGEAVPIVRAPKAHVAIFSDVRMEHDGSYLRVPAELGAVRSDLILDTAASSMVVSPAVVGALGITDKGQADVLGAGGSSQYEAVGIPLLRVGDIERRGVGAVVADLSRFRRNPARPYGGILGNDFLRSFDVEINVPGRRLRLYQPQPSARIHGFQEAHAVANLSSDDGWIVLEVLVNGQPIRAIVDTAAPTSVMNWAAARRAGVTPQTPGLRRREQPTGGLGPGAAETHLFSFKDVRAGRTRFNPSELRIADLRVFEALGLRDQPAMLFGLDMLQETPMLVSYSSRKIFFKPPF